jgi:DNA-directed RNA polymerase specialized sigma24 family protein
MKDETPELSPDLEWMLQGRQASPALILESLIQEYSAQVTRLTYTILDDPSQAMYAAFDTFAAVLENRHRYYGKLGARLFIFAQAIEVCRRYLRERRRQRVLPGKEALSRLATADRVFALVASLDDRLRVPLILYYAHHLSYDEVAVILNSTPSRVQKKIQGGVAYIESLVNAQLDMAQTIEGLLGTCLQDRWQAADLAEISEAQMIQAVDYAIEKKKQASQVRGYLSQAVLGGALLVALIAIGVLTNRNSPSQMTLPPIPRTYVVTQLVRVPIYITSTPPLRLKPPLSTLTIDSSPEEIRQRIMESDFLWYTLWADAYVYDYGPAGYVGPPNIRREQIWISQPYQGLLISGPTTDKVDKSWLLSENRLYPLKNLVPQYIYYPHDYLPSDLLHTYLIFQPKNWARAGMPMTIVEKINTLGMDALIVDVSAKDGSLMGRLTVDAELGIILSIRLYGQDGITVLGDVYLNKLAVDVELPEEIFDSSRRIDHFFKDYRAQEADIEPVYDLVDVTPAGHVSYPKTLPPPGFDIFRSYVTLQWSHPPFGESNNLVIASVDVFVDGYYRGQIEVGNPWSAVCERSPDGRFLAFIEQPDQAPFPSTRMHWLSLNDIVADHNLLPNGSQYGDDVAFSPDSSALAFWGCGVREDNCGVYLLNLSTQKLKKLLPGGYASYFVWSPDGEELALLKEDDTLVVVDASNGQIIYKKYMDWITFVVPPDAPVLKWDVEYPPAQKGLQGCALPGANK